MKLYRYADDCQICTITDINDKATVDWFFHCFANMGDWMSTSRLHLNASKTQVMWLGQGISWTRPPSTMCRCCHDLCALLTLCVTSAWSMTMAAHLSSVCCVSYATFSFGSSTWLQDRCLLKPQSLWSRHSAVVVWTIIMPCFTASATSCSGAYSLSRMQLLVS